MDDRHWSQPWRGQWKIPCDANPVYIYVWLIFRSLNQKSTQKLDDNMVNKQLSALQAAVDETSYAYRVLIWIYRYAYRMRNGLALGSRCKIHTHTHSLKPLALAPWLARRQVSGRCDPPFVAGDTSTLIEDCDMAHQPQRPGRRTVTAGPEAPALAPSSHQPHGIKQYTSGFNIL